MAKATVERVETVYPIRYAKSLDQLLLSNGKRSVVTGGSQSEHDLVVFLPAGLIIPMRSPVYGIVPDMFLLRNNVIGIKYVMGKRSEGIVYCPNPFPSHWEQGMDVTKELGLIEPKIPFRAPDSILGRRPKVYTLA